MKASIVDLRYKMKDILRALDRNEPVTILYRGKVKGVINPVNQPSPGKIQDHPFFGMSSGDEEPVENVMARLREPRHDL